MKSTSILLTILATLSLCACSNNSKPAPEIPEPEEQLTPEEQEFGKKIEEDLAKTNFLNDNYRNYYEIYVGSYCDTNNDGIGDLKGIITKLDYIKDAGFNGIWLMPIHKSPSYHKYDVIDYYSIDPSYGTMDDFKLLLQAAHARGIKIIIDMVVNHSSERNELFRKSYEAYAYSLTGKPLNNEQKNLKDMYTFSTSKDNGGSKMYKVPGKNFYYEGNFSNTMPEFNFDSAYTRKYFEDVYKYYIDMGVDGFRLDAVKYYYYNNNIRCIEYLDEMAKYCKSLNPNFYIVGECWADDAIIEQYYESSVDSFFNFGLSATSIMSSPIFNALNLKGLTKDKYLKSQKYLIEQAGKNIPAPFLDNHDMNRYSVSTAYLTKFYYGLLAMYTGSTFAYYGDEIGTTGTIRRESNYNHDQDVRRHMNWSTTNNIGVCKDPYGADTKPFVHPPVDIQIEDPNSIFNYYKKANLLRNQNPTLTHGKILETSRFEGKEPIANLDKEYNNEKISIVINFDETNHQVYDYSNTNYSDVVGQLVTDTNYYIGDLGNKKISIPPLGIAIIK